MLHFPKEKSFKTIICLATLIVVVNFIVFSESTFSSREPVVAMMDGEGVTYELPDQTEDTGLSGFTFFVSKQHMGFPEELRGEHHHFLGNSVKYLTSILFVESIYLIFTSIHAP